MPLSENIEFIKFKFSLHLYICDSNKCKYDKYNYGSYNVIVIKLGGKYCSSIRTWLA